MNASKQSRSAIQGLGFQARGGPKISEKKIKNIQIHIHIVLRNFQPRQIQKNHCFLIY